MKNKEAVGGKRHRKRWVLLIILGVLVIGVLAVWRWQINNIDAIVQFPQYSQEELEDQLQENDLRFQQMLDEALANAAAMEQQEQEIEPEPEQEPVEEPVAEEAPKPQEPVKKEPTYQELLQAIVDRAYALRSEYIGALEKMESEARSEYGTIPPDQRTKKRLVDFASTYISRATNMEKDCDKKMDQIVSDLDALQKRFGQSKELVEQVKYTYANEKSLKKAWYMSELESRGMV